MKRGMGRLWSMKQKLNSDQCNIKIYALFITPSHFDPLYLFKIDVKIRNGQKKNDVYQFVVRKLILNIRTTCINKIDWIFILNIRILIYVLLEKILKDN